MTLDQAYTRALAILRSVAQQMRLNEWESRELEALEADWDSRHPESVDA